MIQSMSVGLAGVQLLSGGSPWVPPLADSRSVRKVTGQ